ncbi:MAG TPA: hypothetical protein DD379_13270 [Cyanobacteria bacterium UBA11162]|nr:hypothetical protein [Cyanobacteria bacterium UBA11162]
MAKPPQLIYPTLDLFIYDLRESLGQDPSQNNCNRRQFWQKIVENLDEAQLAELEALENPEADYVQLIGEPFESPLDGYYYALQFGDTYALQVNCAGEYKDAYTHQRNEGTQNIQNLEKLKQIIISKINHTLDNLEILPERQGTIGQTWLISVQIADSNQDPKHLAQACYEQLTPNPNWKPDFKEQGRLLGSRIYEYWHSPANWNQEWEEFCQDNYHIVICLFPAGKNIAEIRQKIEDIYLDLTRLFCYRHKIIWAYWQSRRLSAELKNHSAEIKNLMVQFRDLHHEIQSKAVNLNNLEIALSYSWQSLSNYAVNLNELEFYTKTIKLNLENYRKRLQKLERDSNSYLNFLGNFSEFADEKYLQQVETDCENFRPGVALLENLITTIGGLSKIEQIKSDSFRDSKASRTLNKTVNVAAIALFTSLISARILIEQFPPTPDILFVFTPAFLGGIGAGLIPIAIALILLAFQKR